MNLIICFYEISEFIFYLFKLLIVVARSLLLALLSNLALIPIIELLTSEQIPFKI